MDTWVKVIIAAGVIAAACLVLFLFFRIRAWAETRALLNARPRKSSLPLRLLLANFPSANVMNRVILPVTDAPGSPCFSADLLMIHRGGVLMITVRDLRGNVDNPYRGDWRQFAGQKVLQMKNPVETGAVCCRAMNNLLQREQVSNIPIRHLLVYLDPRTRFKIRMEQVLPADKLVPAVKDMRREKFLSAREIRRVRAILQKKRRPPTNT